MEDMDIQVGVPIQPVLDPEFVPSVLWNRAYRDWVAASTKAVDVAIALVRPDGRGSVFRTRILPLSDARTAMTLRYLERILKFLLWQRGAQRVVISGCDALVAQLAEIYSETGARQFDYDFFGAQVYGRPLEIVACAPDEIPKVTEQEVAMGRHLDGCRIGFDLGGSDRKCAAVIDGEVVFSEEVEWSPYFESDPAYHIEGINASLQRAAAHLPRVDAIGGSAAGVYVHNQVRIASLFRGVAPARFKAEVRNLFLDMQARWGNVPFVVVNDGEVTALAGSMAMQQNAILGIAMGTSLAAGYVTPDGNITECLNELAFVPVDHREDAPHDEWSGDQGCGVQYFSQQAVARLAPLAGIAFPDGVPLPEQLIEVQRLMEGGDARATQVYETLGVYLGYTIAHFSEFYDMRAVLLLGRVMSGRGGSVIIEKAHEVLNAVFPELVERIELRTPNEKDKRHGQAVAAASLPALELTPDGV